MPLVREQGVTSTRSSRAGTLSPSVLLLLCGLCPWSPFSQVPCLPAPLSPMNWASPKNPVTSQWRRGQSSPLQVTWVTKESASDPPQGCVTSPSTLEPSRQTQTEAVQHNRATSKGQGRERPRKAEGWHRLEKTEAAREHRATRATEGDTGEGTREDRRVQRV